jgi:aspartate/methionine/tyrosine aminotransferase
MKIKTIDAVNAYKEIKDLKVNSLGDEAALAVWRTLKSMRPVADEYNKSVEDVYKSLQDKEYISMTERAQTYNTTLAKCEEENKPITKDMLSEVKVINDFFCQS